MTPLLKIRRLRKLSQRELSVLTGIDQALVSKIENSRRSTAEPSLPGATPAQAVKLAKFFGHAISQMEVLYPGDYATQEEDAEIPSAESTDLARA